MQNSAKKKYWKRTLKLTSILLSIWFVVAYIFSIMLAPWLNTFTFLGGPLGFWLAQNGAIYIFVVLILIYCLQMNKFDEDFEEDS